MFKDINEGRLDEHKGKEAFQKIVNETVSSNLEKSDKNAIVENHIMREIRRGLGITGKKFENSLQNNEKDSKEVLEKGMLRALGKKLSQTKVKASLKKTANAIAGKGSYKRL